MFLNYFKEGLFVLNYYKKNQNIVNKWKHLFLTLCKIEFNCVQKWRNFAEYSILKDKMMNVIGYINDGVNAM